MGLIASLLLLFPSSDLQAQEVYQALLRGRHEVLPVTSAASGSITATLEENVLIVEGSFSGLTGDFAVNVAGGSHIHLAYAGQNGGIQLNLTPVLDENQRGGTYLAEDNTFTLNEEQMQALAERRMYVNIHSTASTSGELRGQLLPEAEEYYYANLFGSNEVPAVMSRGSGALALELNGSTLTVSGSFKDLEGTFFTQAAGGAHLHLGFAGETGAIQVPLNATQSEDGKSGVFIAEDNTVELDEAQLRSLRFRLLYANIHSSRNPGGELRGQVVGMARTVFRAHLSGSNENPAVTTMAGGVVLGELMADGRLILSGNFRGLESKLAINIAGGAHVHQALAGANGPIVFRIFAAPRGDLRSGVLWPYRNVTTLSEAEITALYQREFYVNIHTIRNSSGELRGQLLPESQMYFSGFLSSIFQIGGQVSTGGGGVKAELSGNKLTLSGAFSGLTTAVATQIAGGAHIHRGMAGSNGPVTQPLNLTLGEDGTSGAFEASNNVFALEEADLEDLLARRKYVNVHTQKYNPGEIRSQLLPEAAAYFVAPLSGASESVPVNTAAGGMTILEVTGNIGITSGSFNNLSAPLATQIAGGAHVHGALAGTNAGVIFRLNSVTSEDARSGTFPAAENVQPINRALLQRLRDRAAYVNVHSTNFFPGEIRGQLLPLATAYFTANLSGFNAVQPKPTEGRGLVKLELHGNELVMSGSFAGLTGDFASDVAGGSHLHAALAGNNGPIQIFTNATLDANLKGGRFLPGENTFELTDTNLEDLLAANLYLNLHSSVFRPGEIRGQVLGETNAFPSNEAAIQSPESGTALVIEGDAATPFTASWSAASDRDPLAYIWQLSTGLAFANLLVNQNVGTELSFTTDYGTIDALLAGAGLEVGQSITLFHRAVASDGSVATGGLPAFITLTRGVVESESNLQGKWSNQIKAVSEFKVYPTLVRSSQSINVRIQAGADQPGTLVLVNQLGQPLQSRTVDLFAGDNRLEWALPELAAGFYFVQLQTEGKLLPLQRIVVGGSR